MKLIPEILKLQDEFVQIRHSIHKNPELGFEEFATSRLVANKLREFGYETYEKVGKTGVVGVMKKGNGDKKIALRADMDALPMQELTHLSYKSEKKNVMHACGHDGHTASLLMAAKYLSNCSFNGTLNLFFQPAEEGLGGARAMLEDNLFERFDADFIFGWHNMPLGNKNKFYISHGAVMASSDRYEFIVRGKGGHGSAPQGTRDPIHVGSTLVGELQSIITRNLDPQETCVFSITSFQAGDAFNIIPETARILGSVRTLSEDVRKLVRERVRGICKGLSQAYGVEIEVDIQDVASVVMNDHQATSMAYEVACEMFGEENCVLGHKPFMASEDFGYFLNARRGAFAFFDNENTTYLHNPHYVFNDELLPRSACYYSGLVLKYLR